MMSITNPQQPSGTPTDKYIKYNDEILGTGAFKKVYKCFNIYDGKEYAWNEIVLDKLDPMTISKIFQEINMYEICNNCSFVINIYDKWFNQDNVLIYTTELAHGNSLNTFVKRIPVPMRLSVIQNWSKQILKALKFLKDQKIIHRDLKSQNIYYDYSTNKITIGDLGLATFMDFQSIQQNTSRQSIVGTTEFMAPEVFTQTYSYQVDVYSFGLLVLELITKEYPYNECKHTMEIFHKITQGVMPECLAKVKNMRAKNFVERCMILDQNERPTVEQLLEDEFFSVDFGDEVALHTQGSSQSASGVRKISGAANAVPQPGKSLDQVQSQLQINQQKAKPQLKSDAELGEQARIKTSKSNQAIGNQEPAPPPQISPLKQAGQQNQGQSPGAQTAPPQRSGGYKMESAASNLPLTQIQVKSTTSLPPASLVSPSTKELMVKPLKITTQNGNSILQMQISYGPTKFKYSVQQSDNVSELAAELISLYEDLAPAQLILIELVEGILHKWKADTLVLEPLPAKDGQSTMTSFNTQLGPPIL